MKKLAALALSLFLTMGIALADTTKDAPAPPPKAAPAKPKAAKKADRSDSAIAAQLEELRQAVQAQQEQLQLLKEELAKRDHQIDEAREAAATANARAADASTKATEAVNTTAEVKSTAVSLNSTVSDLKASNEVLKTTVAKEQADAQKAAEEGPSAIKYKGINITPGGFVEAATVYRSRATGGDINTPFTGIPYPNSALSRVSENNFSARQSRLTMLVDTKVGSAKVTGYVETDFLGTGVTSNNRQSNSYVLRVRQFWGRAAFDSGLTVSAGQMWSMVTENRKGIENRQEALPMMIDPQYYVGWAWQRAYSFRVVQNFDNKFALGFSIEGPQTTFGGRNSGNNFFFNTPGVGGGLYNFVDTAGYTANKSPDILVKAAVDPGMGHFEVVGILSPFRSRVYPCGAVPQPVAGCATGTSVAGAFNDSKVGGGVGATGRLLLFSKKLELAGHVQGGEGVGRYSSAQLADVTARPDGTLAPIRSAAYLGQFELHPSPKLDIFGAYGGEYAARTDFTITNAAGNPVGVGYGSPLANNSGCTTEGFPSTPTPPVFPPPATPANPSSAGTCNGDIHHIIEGTLGFWHNMYQGSKGRLRWGITYSYITKVGWSGNATSATTGAVGLSQRPKALDNMVWTAFRYYLP
ncbi:MAG TPA: hypothetical protein VFN26_23975 [Candidatus Acidoferrum sp.]|nr:hypothetical protein [Candidatus Acidoferrum sp.]